MHRSYAFVFLPALAAVAFVIAGCCPDCHHCHACHRWQPPEPVNARIKKPRAVYDPVPLAREVSRHGKGDTRIVGRVIERQEFKVVRDEKSERHYNLVRVEMLGIEKGSWHRTCYDFDANDPNADPVLGLIFVDVTTRPLWRHEPTPSRTDDPEVLLDPATRCAVGTVYAFTLDTRCRIARIANQQPRSVVDPNEKPLAVEWPADAKQLRALRDRMQDAVDGYDRQQRGERAWWAIYYPEATETDYVACIYRNTDIEYVLIDKTTFAVKPLWPAHKWMSIIPESQVPMEE